MPTANDDVRQTAAAAATSYLNGQRPKLLQDAREAGAEGAVAERGETVDLSRQAARDAALAAVVGPVGTATGAADTAAAAAGAAATKAGEAETARAAAVVARGAAELAAADVAEKAPLVAEDAANAEQARAAAAASQAAAAASAASASLAAAAALVSGKVYDNDAAGLAETADGGYFVVKGDGTSTFAILKHRVGNAAVEVSRYPSKAALDGAVAGVNVLGGKLGSFLQFLGSGTLVPIHTIVNPLTGLDQIAVGERAADGAHVYYVPLAGPGFDASVGRLLTPTTEGVWQFRGTDLGFVPWGMDGDRAFFRADTVRKRMVLTDVLVEGDHGLPLGGYPATARVALASNLRSVIADINGMTVHGQSLSVGALSQLASTLSQPYSNISFAGGVKSSSPTDKASFAPLVENNLGEDNATGTNRGETICSAAANHAVRLAAINKGIDPSKFVIFACTAGQGGQKITSLNKGTAPYARLLAQIVSAKALATAQGKSFAVHAVPWIQGETDCDQATSRAAYLASLLQLIADLNADIMAITGQTSPVHLLIYQTAYKAQTTGGAIALAQMDAVKLSPLIHLAGPIQHLPYSDGTHTTNVGENWMGHTFGRSFYQLVVEGVVPDCLWPVSATAIGTELTMRWQVPQPPLLLTDDLLPLATDYGFKVLDDSGAPVLSAPSVPKSGIDIKWTMSRPVTTGARIRFALDYLGAGLNIEGGASGNLRDSTADKVMVNGVLRPLPHLAPACEIFITNLEA